MPLGTIDRTPPPFFRQGPSALSKLTVFGALAIFLMVADVRLGVTQPLRAAVANVLYPAQWMVLQSVGWARRLANYFQNLQEAQQAQLQALRQLGAQSQRASQTEQLLLENERLRNLLALRPRLQVQAQPAQVLYDAADPYSRRVVIDRGMVDGIVLGSPVLDESGVLGQVTRVYASVSEVTLVTDRDQAIPVLNTRTGARGVAFGDPGIPGLELRFIAANADVQAGDVLSTSGVDGIYPPGLQVARVHKVERRSDSAFARIMLQPVALVQGALHVMVLNPMALPLTPRPAAETASAPARKAARK